MSELQNRIIQQLQTREGKQPSASPYSRHQQLLRAAFEVYFAVGGDIKELDKYVHDDQPPNRISTPEAIANLVVEIAAVSHASDLDMVQAAYNWIDEVYPSEAKVGTPSGSLSARVGRRFPRA